VVQPRKIQVKIFPSAAAEDFQRCKKKCREVTKTYKKIVERPKAESLNTVVVKR
jgi:hypothetical protein